MDVKKQIRNLQWGVVLLFVSIIVRDCRFHKTVESIVDIDTKQLQIDSAFAEKMKSMQENDSLLFEYIKALDRKIP